MTTTRPSSSIRPSLPGAAQPVARAEAQAYCGPAHGQRWAVDEQVDVPAVVDLAVAGGSIVRYRLVTHPRTGRPARDHRGRYLYLPSLHQPSPAAWDGRW